MGLFGGASRVGVAAFLTGLLAVATWAEPYPTRGEAVVDGAIEEWNLETDYFGDLNHYAGTKSTLMAKLYLRYDCAKSVLYALVLQVSPDYPVITPDPDETYIRVDGTVRVNAAAVLDGVAPDFAWVGLNYSGSGTARGWEASFSLAPATYNVEVHNNMWDGSENQTVRTQREGLTLAVFCPQTDPMGAIGDLVWNDVDNDGIYAPERGFDLPIAGVGIELWRDLDGDRLFEPSGDDAQPPRSLSTSATGNYRFDGLIPGVYFVSIPSPPLFHVWSSALTVDADNQQDNDDNGIQESFLGAPTVSPAIEISVGEVDLTVDFAFVDPGVGNLVWADDNRNGIVDGDEAGISGVLLELWEVPGGTGTPVRLSVTTSSSEGFYSFGGLFPGQYQIVIPESNFESGGPLQYLRLSSPGGVAVDDGVDDDDNGIQEASGLRVVSPVFSLLEDLEPTDADTETGRGAAQDNEPFATDIDNDLTKDFGFWAEPPTAARLDRFSAVRLASDRAGLGWTTFVESDLIGFHIERSIAAGIWVTVNDGLIPALGSDGGTHHYEAADADLPEVGHVQYRLIGVTTRGRREVLAAAGLNAGVTARILQADTVVSLEVTGAEDAWVVIETATCVQGPWSRVDVVSLDAMGHASLSLKAPPGQSAGFYRVR